MMSTNPKTNLTSPEATFVSEKILAFDGETKDEEEAFLDEGTPAPHDDKDVIDNPILALRQQLNKVWKGLPWQLQGLLLASLLMNGAMMLRFHRHADMVEQEGWVRPNKVYGFVHMAKTAGTEINGMLANHFERVCGNKGYSYDAFLTNERQKEVFEETGHANSGADLHDAVSRTGPNRNRAKVPTDWMEEIGFDDCDYVALESHRQTKIWHSIAEKTQLELHVPCREPLNHLMSELNFVHKTMDCQAENTTEHILELLGTVRSFDRLGPSLGTNPNITMKCFDPIPPQLYVDYMGNILQRKRVESKYFEIATNRPRDKEHECIWKQPQEFKDQVHQILLDSFYYYSFCNACVGSENEIALG